MRHGGLPCKKHRAAGAARQGSWHERRSAQRLQGCRRLDRYFEGQTPVPLFRGRKQGESTDLLQPTLVGWYNRDGRPRPPDVLVEDEVKGSPQYQDASRTVLAVEGKSKPLTADILRNADKLMVQGCRTMHGRHRGVSVFHKVNQGLRNNDWFKLDAGTDLPAQIAVTRDADATESDIAIHYTLAPKDDMSLSSFLQYMKGLAAKAKAV